MASIVEAAATGWTTLRDLLLLRAEAQPRRLAFHDGVVGLTFAELAERAQARAETFRASGVGSGDRVALVLTPGLRLVEAFWGLQVLAAVPCVFNPSTPTPTLARRVDRVRPTLVATDASLDETPAATTLSAESPRGPNDLAFFQLTSGVSGEPRMAMITQRNVHSFLRSLDAEGHCRSDDVLVSWLPPWHDFGLVRFVIGAVYQGAPCHLVEPAIRTIPKWLVTISDVRGTLTAAPDFAYRLAPRLAGSARVDLSSLRIASNGAEPVRAATIDSFEAAFGLAHVVVPGYGLAEATLGVSSHLPRQRIVTDARGNVSCGRPMPYLEVNAGRSVDEPEEIRVRGDAVFAGYFDAPEETARVLHDGWLHTGDSGYMDPAGRLYVLGRLREMIKRGGAVIAPRELEEAAERVSGVRVAAAAGIPAQGLDGESVVVAVEARLSARRTCDRIEAEVSREIVKSLGFAPSRVSVVPRRTIPRTENGKLRHARLRAALLSGEIA